MTSCLRPLVVLVAGFACACPSTYAYTGGQGQAASSTSSASQSNARPATSPSGDNIFIPGPLRSFLRMAGISQKVAPDDVLSLLAHNVYIQGYGDGRPTEFLILLDRYVHQARELQTMAGPSATIHVDRCEDAGPLLQILGYRLRQGCGEKGVSLVTSVPERAFLTIDSGSR
jgi:hypothetical protein